MKKRTKKEVSLKVRNNATYAERDRFKNVTRQYVRKHGFTWKGGSYSWDGMRWCRAEQDGGGRGGERDRDQNSVWNRTETDRDRDRDGREQGQGQGQDRTRDRTRTKLPQLSNMMGSHDGIGNQITHS